MGQSRMDIQIQHGAQDTELRQIKQKTQHRKQKRWRTQIPP